MRTRDSAIVRNLRFLFVLPSLELGGAERQALLLARHLVETEGARVRMWGFGPPGPVLDVLDRLGVKGHAIALPPGGARAQQARLAARFVRDARSGGGVDALLPYSRVANRLCGLVWPLTGAGVCVWNHRDGTGAVPSSVDRWAMRRTPAVVSNSEHGAAYLARAYGLPRSRITVIRNGVELAAPQATRDEWRARLGAGPRTFVACMVANLTSNKDHATLLRAWQRVVDEIRGADGEPLLALAGYPGDTADATRALISELRLTTAVRLAGQTHDVSGLLAACDLGVFSSRREGSPNGVLECMAAGLAVVATDNDGVREALGPTGAAYLVPPDDHERFARAVLALAHDARRREEAGRLNMERVRATFSPHEMCTRMTALCAAHLAR